MKKLITLSVICLITSILFSSCRSGISITKRHYTKGYYVAHNKGLKSLPSNRSEEKTTPVKPQEAVATVNVPAENVENTSSSKPLINNESSIATSTPKKANRSIFKRSTKETVSASDVVINNKEEVQVSNKSLNGEKAIAGSDREALSLLWIVIVVLLILWALGFVADGFGFGGLIHILLVIALILLILWLLRVI